MYPDIDVSQPVPVDVFRAVIPVCADPIRYPDELCAPYLGLAHENLNPNRYGDMYAMAQCWYAAHYILIMVPPVAGSGGGSGAGGGIATGGLVSSKSVGSVSVSYDVNSTLDEGAGFWNSTLYGRMLYQQMQLAGMGPIQMN